MITLKEFCSMYGHLPHIDAFKRAYTKGVLRDEVNFPLHHRPSGWMSEYAQFVASGGDADEPIGEPKE